MYRLPNPRKGFEHWRELIDDICFNEMTIKDAAKKWQVSQPAISQWLKKHPSIKRYYYSRPWVIRQQRLQFLSEECTYIQDLIDLVEDSDGSDEVYISKPRYTEIQSHLPDCKDCKDYQIQKRLSTGIPYRLDCPSLAVLIDYLDSKSQQRDTVITGHLLRCHFCNKEFSQMVAFMDEDIFRILNLSDEEQEIYPQEGWRVALTDADLLEDLIDVVEHRCLQVENGLIAQYCSWRQFRASIIDVIGS